MLAVADGIQLQWMVDREIDMSQAVADFFLLLDWSNRLRRLTRSGYCPEGLPVQIRAADRQLAVAVQTSPNVAVERWYRLSPVVVLGGIPLRSSQTRTE